MTKLEDLKPHITLRGILPDTVVTVINSEWFGSTAIELTYKTPEGKVGNELLYRQDESRITIVPEGRPGSFDGDGELFRLVSEAYRLDLAHLWDRLLGIHTSLIELP